MTRSDPGPNRRGNTVGGAGQYFVEPIDPPLYSRRHFITCKFYQPSKLFVLMPVSDEQHQ
jgi:hypothetical protein